MIKVYYTDEREFQGGTSGNFKENGIMKKLLIAAAAALTVVALTGCMSLRTPTSGARAKNVYYNTFFGISLESAVYGDGLIVGQK